jgi:hypothetical protein
VTYRSCMTVAGVMGECGAWHQPCRDLDGVEFNGRDRGMTQVATKCVVELVAWTTRSCLARHHSWLHLMRWARRTAACLGCRDRATHQSTRPVAIPTADLCHCSDEARRETEVDRELYTFKNEACL